MEGNINGRGIIIIVYIITKQIGNVLNFCSVLQGVLPPQVYLCAVEISTLHKGHSFISKATE